MNDNMRQRHNARQAFYASAAVDLEKRPAHSPGMPKPKKPPRKRDRVFFLEWRTHLDLTQEEVAERADVSQSTVQRVENGALPYNEDTLEKFAFAFGVDVPDLFVNPLQPDPPKLVYNKLRAAPKEIQERALAILDALLKAG